MNSPLNDTSGCFNVSALRVCACPHGRVGKRVVWAAYSTCDPQDRRISASVSAESCLYQDRLYRTRQFLGERPRQELQRASWREFVNGEIFYSLREAQMRVGDSGIEFDPKPGAVALNVARLQPSTQD
jgi:hypothetical protein